MPFYECEVSINTTILVEADDPELAREEALMIFFDHPEDYMDERDIDAYPLEDED